MKELFREIAVFNTDLFRCMLFCNIKIGLNDDTHDVVLYRFREGHMVLVLLGY